jgi:hypothetical protein
MSLFPSQCNTIYIIFFLSFSLSQHVSALLGHLQVLITMLNCHTVLIIIFATLFFFSDTHTRIVCIKYFFFIILSLKILLKFLFYKIFLNSSLPWPSSTCYMCVLLCVVAVFLLNLLSYLYLPLLVLFSLIACCPTLCDIRLSHDTVMQQNKPIVTHKGVLWISNS